MRFFNHTQKIASNTMSRILVVFILLSSILSTSCSDDTTGKVISISIDDTKSFEGDTQPTSVEFRVMLSDTSGKDVSIDYTTQDGSAISGTDYLATSGTLLIPSGSVSGTITVQIMADTVFEPDETFTVLISNAINAGIDKDRATCTINDDDELTVTIDNQSAMELDERSTMTMLFTVSLSSPPPQTVTVDYMSEDGTASSMKNDYESVAGTLVFDAGKQTQTIGVKILGDDLYEQAETFNIHLLSSDLATIQKDIGVGTIENNDSPPVLTISNAQLSEADCSTSMEFDLQLDTQSGLAVNMDYQTADDTATIADNDYQPANGSVTIEPGELYASIPVTINCDDKGEPDETFILNLSNITGATPDTTGAIGTIINDDGPSTMSIADTSVEEGDSGVTLMTFIVTLSRPIATDESVDFATADGTATSADGDYTHTVGTLSIPAGQTEGAIQVEINGDSIFEADEIVNVVLSNSTSVEITDAAAKGTIINDDEPPVLSVTAPTQAEGDNGTTTFVFDVALSQAEQLDVSVQYSTEDGTATIADGDYVRTAGTLIIPAGSTTGTIEVAVEGDTKYEPDETFFLNLSNPVHVTISQPQTTATITNDDTIPEISIDAVSVHEGADSQTSSMTFTVSLSKVSGVDVSVDYATSDNTATASDADYQQTAGTVIVPAGATSTDLHVTIIGDDLYEPDERFFLDLTTPINATLVDTQTTGTILNDDPMQSLSIDDQSVIETAQSATFTITLSGIQGVDVPLNYTTADGTATSADNDFVSTSGGATIQAGQTTASVSVGINNDDKYELDETFTVSISLPPGPAVANIADGTGQATIIDDDNMPSISVNDVSLIEGNSGTSNMNFTVALSAIAGVDVTAEYASSDATATAGQDYSQVTGTISIPAGTITAPVTVPIYGDDWYEDDEDLVLHISNPGNATISDDTGTGTIDNDDSQPTISIQDNTAAEGADGETSDMLFSVLLSNPSGFDVSVDYTTSDGTAFTSDNDYQQTTGTLLFSPGSTLQQIAVTIVGDDTYELDEQFGVSLTNATNAALSDSVATGSIINDDRALYFVDPTGDDSDGMSWQTAFNTIQQGVDAAYSAGGGQVWVAAGTYTNSGGTQTVLVMREGVSIYGGFEGYGAGSGAQESEFAQRDWVQNPTIMDGQDTAYHVIEGADNATIDGFTITGGNANGSSYPDAFGGGMYNVNCSPTVSHCIFTTNSAQLGGGIYNNHGPSSSITNCQFINNSATSGMAIANENSSAVISNCTFESNTAPAPTEGGAIYNFSSTPSINDCVFANNTTAIVSKDTSGSGQPTIADCLFLQNSSAHNSGALVNISSSPQVERCRFMGNFSGSSGGAVGNLSASPTFTNCVFSANTATDNGGAMWNYNNSYPNISNCTFFGNSANQGGAIYCNSSAITATNSVLWGNTASSGVSIYNINVFRLSDWSYCDVEDCGGDSSWSHACGWNEGGSIDEDPLFADPDGADNTPGTQDDDLNLAAGSPCIDAADGDTAPALDIIGNTRYDDPLVSNTGTGNPDYSDMGAYEAQ